LDLSLTLRRKYHERLKDHQKDVIRDFCDALILAKKEAFDEAKESAPYLTDENLGFVIFDLFVGKYLSVLSKRTLQKYLSIYFLRGS